jgi:hypothetical protein
VSVLYVLLALIGGLYTALMLWWHYGAFEALLGTSFIASFLVLGAAVLIASRPS